MGLDEAAGPDLLAVDRGGDLDGFGVDIKPTPFLVLMVSDVVDEALTDFLSFCNRISLAIMDRWPARWTPTFSFRAWIFDLSAGILLLFALTSLAFRESRSLALAGIPFSVFMIGNSMAHIGTSIYCGCCMPGIY